MDGLPLEISNFFLAMQAGRAGADRLADAFAADAVYTEPFTGARRRHQGREAVMAAMAMGWEQPMPEMHIRVDRAEVAGAEITLDWTCFSPALPGGQGSGTNVFRMKDGKIARLDTTLKGGSDDN